MAIIAANFKTNHTRKETKEYLKRVNDFINENKLSDEVYVFPTAMSLDEYEIFSNISVGVQNAYPTERGSYTGEIGSSQLDEFGIKTILIGHSERRHILDEDQELIVSKYKYYSNLGYKIIYCIGEPLEVKKEGYTAILSYLFKQLEGIDITYENLIVAYEPVWAIGTGITAQMKDIENIHNLIKKKINKPLLYGGSVKKSNIKDILSISNVDGALIGTASWDDKDFCTIMKISNDLKNKEL